MKIRSPRSSFNHAAVMTSGRRRSRSRAISTGAPRTAWASALELARDRDCRTAHVVGVSARLEADVDVQPAVAGRLGVAGDAELVEQRPELGGSAAHVGEVGARLRVEVQAQLVGVLGVV